MLLPSCEIRFIIIAARNTAASSKVVNTSVRGLRTDLLVNEDLSLPQIFAVQLLVLGEHGSTLAGILGSSLS